MAYATIDDMRARFDVRLLTQLISDTGQAASSTTGNTNLQASLDDASGAIEAALLMGGRYTTADLSGLTGNSAKYLARMTCEIAMSYLMERRKYADDDARTRALEKSEEHLEMLRKGSHIFNVAAVVAAGRINGEVGPTTVELEDSHLIRYRTKHYYPRPRTPDDR